MKAFSRFFVRRWKLIVNIVTIAALIGFVYLIREQLFETWQEIRYVRWWYLLLIIPLQILNYDSQARLYRSLFMIVGNKFRYRQMYETALELNFVNNVFPSGGVSGISYFGVRMRSNNVTAGKATLVQIMKLALVFASFELLLIVGLFLVALQGDVNALLLMISVAISTLLIVGSLLMIYVLGSRERVDAFHRLLRFVAQAGYRTVFPGRPPKTIKLTKAKGVLDDLHKNFQTIRSKYHELRRPLLHALSTNLTEIMTIYVVYLAFEQLVNPGAVILAYSVANFAGLISVLPGGVGIYEAIMTSVLVAAGVPIAVSLPVTFMYRVLSTLVQMPPGYYFYHRTLHKGNKLISRDV